MKLLRYIILVWMAIMVGVTLYAVRFGDPLHGYLGVFLDPWGLVWSADLGYGFCLAAVWIVFREKSLIRALPWVFCIIPFGFFVFGIYLMRVISQSSGDWQLFFMGKSSQ